MKRSLLGMLATLAVALLPNARTASAQDINFASHSEIMSVLERQNQRIAELEATQLGGGGAGGCSSCGDSCCDLGCGGCDPCCRPAGVIAGAELLFLKPHHAQGVGGVFADLEYDYETAPRLWAGYQGSDGLGWRVRYFEFNHSTSDSLVVAVPGVAAFGVADSVNYDTYVFDLEFIDSMNLGCNWDASWFAGFRYVEFDETRSFAAAAALPGVLAGVGIDRNIDFHGYGLTAGGELRRCIGNGLAGFVNTRGSVLFGSQTDSAEVAAAVVVPGAFGLASVAFEDENEDLVRFMWEAQAGIQWTRELEAGGYLFARAAAEVQFWDDFASDRFEPLVGDPQAWGLGGGTISVGIIR